MSTRLTGPTLVVSAAISDADTNTTVLAIEVPAGTFIPAYGVSLYVAEAFAGGTPSLDVGDGTDPNGWVATADINETVAGVYTSAASPFAVDGKIYTSADTIDVVVSASLTDGTAYVLVLMYDLSDVSIAAVA